VITRAASAYLSTFDKTAKTLLIVLSLLPASIRAFFPAHTLSTGQCRICVTEVADSSNSNFECIELLVE